MSPSNCGGFKKEFGEYSIEIERISRDEIHAHILASPSSAEELRNHLRKLKAYRDGETES